MDMLLFCELFNHVVATREMNCDAEDHAMLKTMICEVCLQTFSVHRVLRPEP
jgi:hypothetical protein